MKKSNLLFTIIAIIIILIVLSSILIILKIDETQKKVTKFTPVRLEIERYLYNIFPDNFDDKEITAVNVKNLKHSITIGADWILKMQEQTGRFNYWYDPYNNEFSSINDDNFLRQAGTSFSLTLIYEITGDKRYLDGAEKNLKYLFNYKKDLDGDKSYFLHEDKAKLGGIALPMLVMLKIKDITKTDKYDEVLKRTANMIIYLQNLYNTGRYKSTYIYNGMYDYEKKEKWESKIYPGEAMYALAFMYKLFKDEKYKKSIDWALDFYKNPKYWQNHAFLPWTISAFVLMYELTKEKKCSNYVIKLSDYLLSQQNINKNSIFYGSFHNKPSANTGSYMEGLADAIILVKNLNDEKRLKKYSNKLKMGYNWLLKLQLDETKIKKFKNPEKTLGGFREDFSSTKLRIDNTQHAISSIAKGLKNLYNVEIFVNK